METALLPELHELGVGCIAFSPLAQGLLTSKYLEGKPPVARISNIESSMNEAMFSGETLGRVRALNGIAQQRGQTLAQMAIAWTLRDPRVTSSLIGARSVAQLDDSLDALNNLSFSAEELAAIDQHAIDTPEIDLWRSVSIR